MNIKNTNKMQEPFKVCIRIKPIEGKQKFKTIKNGSETVFIQINNSDLPNGYLIIISQLIGSS